MTTALAFALGMAAARFLAWLLARRHRPTRLEVLEYLYETGVVDADELDVLVGALLESGREHEPASWRSRPKSAAR